jgi:FlaA1/EpsC-like NDP-sugar epimerase
VGLCPWVAAMVRFEGTDWPSELFRMLALFTILSVPAKIAILWRIGLYRRLWRFASVGDLEGLAVATSLNAVAGAVAGLIVLPRLGLDVTRLPYSIVLIGELLGTLAVALPRLLVRVLGRRPRRSSAPFRRTLVVGAGAAGDLIVRELQSNPQLRLLPVAFLDDDPSKHHRQLHGVPIVGRIAELAAVVRTLAVDEVVIAMPTAPGLVIRDVVRAATAAGVATRTVPGLFEILDGRKSVRALREVRIEDLLRREAVETDLARVRTLAAGKTVLVTGAGGSIGSELCRQIARLEPSRLVVLGRGENSVFELLEQMRAVAPGITLEPIIADVRDQVRLERVFRATRPHTVFHAAAHKHVPLMEQNVSEAILNNVLGTQIVAELASCYHAERFVLISSDKAVRPTSVMGATKRLAEGIVQELGRRCDTRFVAVRFGNVLGSRGSVIPTFLRQIHQGGPLTITHPEMRRYFMTIPEAVQLVLQAGAMGVGGEVFVLDMGEPVKVLDLARDLVRLSGLEEGRDIEIRITGMRPGEKLYEELFFSAEHAGPTEHPKVLRARNAALRVDGSPSVSDLIRMAQRNAPEPELRRTIRALVPEYRHVTAEAASVLDVAPLPSEAGTALGAAPIGTSPLLVASRRADSSLIAGAS